MVKLKIGGRRPRLAVLFSCRHSKRFSRNGHGLVADQHRGLRETADRAGFAPALRHRGDWLFVLSHTAFSYENVQYELRELIFIFAMIRWILRNLHT